MLRLTRLALLAILAAVALPASAQRLPDHVQPSHYTLWFAPDFATNTFRGTARIEIRARRATPSITLNSAEIAFQSATVTAGGRTQDARVSLDAGTETATLVTPAPIPAGPAVIDIAFTGILNNQLRGFYLSTANGKKFAVTQLEATDARRMFPGFDEPAFKATFDLSVTAPAEYVAISNGAVTADVPGPGQTHTVTFARTPRMSSYLVALLVGEFQCRTGRSGDTPIRVCSTPDKFPLTAFALEATEAILRLQNDYFGIRYPFGKLDIIGIPDFSAGAMENAGAITFRESTLLADPGRASLDTRKRIATVISHEIAHQWFGDLVTMQWWDDIWLNEGFATWMESKPVATWKPEWHMERAQADDTLLALGTDSQEATRAIRMRVSTPEEINEVFDPIAYEKTAAVLRMIERYIGEAPFRAGITSYLSKYAYANAAGEDFWRELTRVTGQPVDRIMASFVTQPGAPVVGVTASCSAGRTRLVLRQGRFSGNPSATAPRPQTWTMPVCARSLAGGAPVCTVVRKATATLTIPGCDPVLVNPEGSGYFLTEYAPDDQARLAAAATLSPVERLRLAGDAWWMARSGRHPMGAYLDVAATFANEATPEALGEVAGRLGTILGTMTAPGDRARLQGWIRATFGPALSAIGVAPKAGDDDAATSRRAILIGLVGITGGDTAVQAEGRALAERYFADRASLPGTLVPTVLTLAAMGGDAALYDRVLARARALTAEPEEYYRHLNALAVFPGDALARRTVELALSPEVRSQDVPRLIGGLLGRADVRATVWRELKGRWDAVTGKLDPYQGLPGVVGSVGAFCSMEDAADVREFFAGHPVPPAARALAKGLERIETCAATRTRQQPGVTAWLDRKGIR